MTMSNYPHGFANGIALRGVPIQQLYPGEVFWVNNTGSGVSGAAATGVLAKKGLGGSDGNPGTYQKPKQSIAGAITAATENRGDVIIVMPGHIETVVTDGGLAFSKAGVAIIGLGVGTLRPVIILDVAAAAAVTVSAANVTLSNFELRASFADVTNAIDLTAAWFSLLDCEFTEEGTNLNFLDYINCSSTSDNTADGLRVEGCVGTAIDTSQNSFIKSGADIDRLVYKDNKYLVDHANCLQSILVLTGKILTDCIITDNVHVSLQTGSPVFVSADQTTNTGIVARNLVGHADTAAVELIDCDGVRHFDNLSTSADGVSGAVEPDIDSIT